MRELTFTGEEGRLREAERLTREQILLRGGAVCAILGAVVSVVAGASFGNLTNDAGIETVLSYLAARPRWHWPLVHLGFIFGALLWVAAFVALAASLREGRAWALARLGAASIIVGAAVHIIDASINGFGLAALAHDWAAAPSPDQVSLVSDGHVLLRVLEGTWASVIGLFHGLPFILSGLAVARSHAYPAWLGWAGVLGGAGSLFAGVLMFLGADFIPSWLFIVFALVISVWMAAMGVLMWRRAAGDTY